MLLPGKGAHLILNKYYLEWVTARLAEVEEQYPGDDEADADLELVQKRLVSEYGWIAEEDKFGKKVYMETMYKEGTLRITVVVTSRANLMLDIREWYTKS
jgi:hypothetical protein